jgi:hypothetical protein
MAKIEEKIGSLMSRRVIEEEKLADLQARVRS